MACFGVSDAVDGNTELFLLCILLQVGSWAALPSLELINLLCQ